MAAVMFQAWWRVKRSQVEKVKVEIRHDEKGKKFKGYKVTNCNGQLEQVKDWLFLFLYVQKPSLLKQFKYAFSIEWHLKFIVFK